MHSRLVGGAEMHSRRVGGFEMHFRMVGENLGVLLVDLRHQLLRLSTSDRRFYPLAPPTNRYYFLAPPTAGTTLQH